MTLNLPVWAKKTATPQDRKEVQNAYHKGTIEIKWPQRKAIRAWAKAQDWPKPGYIFEDSFINKMLKSDENFALALNESGIKIIIPLERYTLPANRLKELDALYDARDENGRATDWGSLVEALREIRRAVEAGVTVEVEGNKLKSFSSFYSWAHGRYHMLEDGYDDWIGHDK